MCLAGIQISKQIRQKNFLNAAKKIKLKYLFIFNNVYSCPSMPITLGGIQELKPTIINNVQLQNRTIKTQYYSLMLILVIRILNISTKCEYTVKQPLFCCKVQIFIKYNFLQNICQVPSLAKTQKVSFPNMNQNRSVKLTAHRPDGSRVGHPHPQLSERKKSHNMSCDDNGMPRV